MASYNFGISGLLVLIALWLATKLITAYLRPRSHSTKLRGPPRTNLIFGASREIQRAPDAHVLYEEWANNYGSVYEIPRVLGSKMIALMDPKAIMHFYQSERSVYVKTENDKAFIGNIFGRGLLWAEGETHKRQRKALTPAFSNAAIRRLTCVFFDSAYKLKTIWDASLESTDGAVIEVQSWMNRVALDSIGIAGFSHDFRYIEGHSSPVTAAFESLQVTETTVFGQILFLLSVIFPILINVPTRRMRVFWELRRSLNDIAQRLLENTRKEKEGNVAEELTDKSVIGLLLKAQISGSELYMTQEEVVAQMNVLLLAGYETTSVALTWALIELSKHPEIQDKLRQELTRFSLSDPTWDQLVSELPFLDATALEVLRLHPPVVSTIRVAACDDVIPLGTPIVTPSGETVSSIAVTAGSAVLAPIRCINRSEALWGADAKEFKPARWFDEINVPARELQGHRHLLTFHEGPRTCLGKSFALAEFKAVLSVLVRNFVFELPDGPETKIENHIAIVPRPKVAGQVGAKVPLTVRRVE